MQKFEKSQQDLKFVLYSHFDDLVLNFFGTIFQDAYDALEGFLLLILHRVTFQVVLRDI